MLDYIKVVLSDDLPYSVKGFTLWDGFENYTILLNAKLNSETLCKTYDHELEHIKNGDFDSIISVSDVENLRHVI